MKTRGVLIYCDAFQGDTPEAIENCMAAAKGIHMQQKMQVNADLPAAKRELRLKKGIQLTDADIEDLKRNGMYTIKVVTVDI